MDDNPDRIPCPPSLMWIGATDEFWNDISREMVERGLTNDSDLLPNKDGKAI